jgi:chromate reductase
MSEERGITVLGICGSLRAGSYNKATLQTAIETKPPGMTIETADIGSIPLYNEDVRALGFPLPSRGSEHKLLRPMRCFLSLPNTTTRCPGS